MKQGGKVLLKEEMVEKTTNKQGELKELEREVWHIFPATNWKWITDADTRLPQPLHLHGTTIQLFYYL